MREDNELQVGDRVEMVRDKNQVYKTIIEDMTGNGLFLMGVPIFNSRYVVLRVGEVVSLVFYRETGRYSTKMRIVGFDKKGEIRYAWLYQLAAPAMDQRRENYRINDMLNVQVCKYLKSIERELPSHPDIELIPVLDTVVSSDISVAGISLVTRREYEPGEKYLLKLFIEEPRDRAPAFGISAEVARSAPGRRSNTINVGMRFINQTKQMSEYLSKYILAQQQKQIRYKRLIGGNSAARGR